MHAAVLHGAGTVVLEDRAAPVARHGWTTVRVTAVGLCGSDVHYYDTGRNGTFEVAEPFVLGHESCGTVAECPARTWAPGTPVAVDPAIFGDAASGPHRHLMPGGSYLGSASTRPHRDGALQQFVQVPDDRICPLPDGADPIDYVLAEPLAVALHALARAGSVDGSRVLVCGAGPIGLLCAAALDDAGACEVTVSDVKESALALAREWGLATLDGRRPLPSSRHDHVFECSGTAAGLSSALAAARIGGTVVQVGTLPPVMDSVSLAALMGKELTHRGSMRFNGELREAVAMLSRRPHLNRLVSATFDLSRTEAALRHAADPGSVGKTVVILDGRTSS